MSVCLSVCLSVRLLACLLACLCLCVCVCVCAVHIRVYIYIVLLYMRGLSASVWCVCVCERVFCVPCVSMMFGSLCVSLSFFSLCKIKQGSVVFLKGDCRLPAQLGDLFAVPGKSTPPLKPQNPHATATTFHSDYIQTKAYYIHHTQGSGMEKQQRILRLVHLNICYAKVLEPKSSSSSSSSLSSFSPLLSSTCSMLSTFWVLHL